MTLKLSMTCGPYDRAAALIDGRVKPDGIDLAITVNDDDVDRQQRAARGDFDVCEFFAGTYIADLPFKKLGFTAIPIYVKRMFRHSYIYINKKSGIRSAADLNGKRVGVQTWITTAALWAKGLLEDEYAVDLNSITWVAWQGVRIPDWKAPAGLKLVDAPADRSQYDLLASGEIDAAITTEIWAPGLHPDIDFLFPDYPARERDYFKRTRCFPIMHLLLVRNSVLDAHPWVARSLYDAWEASKQKVFTEQENWQRIHQTSLWYRGLWEEERAAAGGDIYPWGFTKCRHELETMLEYAHRQALTPRRYRPEDLFPASMLET
jgi:4,5-dihydroxyphthalate decarboxylase